MKENGSMDRAAELHTGKTNQQTEAVISSSDIPKGLMAAGVSKALIGCKGPFTNCHQRHTYLSLVEHHFWDSRIKKCQQPTQAMKKKRIVDNKVWTESY